MKSYLVSIYDAHRGQWSPFVLSEVVLDKARLLPGNLFDKNYKVVDLGKYVKGRFRSEANGLRVRRFETTSGHCYEVFRDCSARPV